MLKFGCICLLLFHLVFILFLGVFLCVRLYNIIIDYILFSLLSLIRDQIGQNRMKQDLVPI